MKEPTRPLSGRYFTAEVAYPDGKLIEIQICQWRDYHEGEGASFVQLASVTNHLGDEDEMREYAARILHALSTERAPSRI